MSGSSAETGLRLFKRKRKPMNSQDLPVEALLIFAVVVSACAAPASRPSSPSREAPAAPTPATPKRLSVAIFSAPSAISTFITGGGGKSFGSDVIEQLTNVGLTTGDDRGGTLPRLATEVPTVENGKHVRGLDDIYGSPGPIGTTAKNSYLWDRAWSVVRLGVA